MALSIYKNVQKTQHVSQDIGDEQIFFGMPAGTELDVSMAPA